jgi:phosphoribosylformylglycinamidine cyclo-ligase
MAPNKPSLSYRDAGVSIEEGDRAVSRIKRLARGTFSKNVLTGIGSFGAAFDLKGWKRPVLISSADGVGTKLKVAFLANRHNTIGEDLVNHCVNDIMVQGAEPLFFLDYFATGKLSADVLAEVVEGLARGCKANGCALIGGETAEMPGLYSAGEYDLAGFIVGAVERKGLLTGEKIRPGDALLALPSTGLHTNGYSLARKLFFEVAGHKVGTHVAELGCTVGDELLKVHRSYARPIRLIREHGWLRGAAHITGGGITGNTPRMLPDGLGVEIDTRSWQVPAVFEVMRSIGNVPVDDWRQTFNLGVGMILAVPAKKAGDAVKALKKAKEPCWQIGQVVKLGKRQSRVEYRA